MSLIDFSQDEEKQIHSIWVEKYRPRTFDEVKGQDKIVSRIKSFIKSKNMPHLLFSGPAGVGKTTLSLVIARELYGENYKSSFLELNASDERGIDVVRTKVKDFARTRAIDSVPFKIIYLDECDALTKEAQQALRRTMENYTSTTRFILSCNYSSKIIDPIQSRCTVFRFQPLPKEDVFTIIDEVAKNENITLTQEAKEAVYEVTQGDCRRTKNLLQSCAAIEKDITEDTVYSLSSIAKPKEIKEFIQLAITGKFIESRKMLLDTMLRHGLSGLDIIKQIQSEIWNVEMSDKHKVKLIDRCGEVEFRMTEGSDEYVQLEAFLAYLTLYSA
ncbi:MAG: replication factor C small subunit [Candidatus Woesearchaeota archaeon]|jgi:replication factor C small subunit